MNIDEKLDKEGKEFTPEKRNRKIDLDKIIEELFSDIEAVEKSDKPQGQKTQAFRRAADKVIRALYGKRAQSKDDPITRNTATKYLTKVRNKVTEKGWLHHSFDTNIERLHKRYPGCNHLISSIEGLPLEKTRLAVKSLKDKLLKVDRLEKALAKVDVESSTYASQINEISKSFEDWAEEIQCLKSAKKADRQSQTDNLIATFEEARNLYNDLGGLKVDHEVMRWLIKDSFSAAENAESSAFALSKKKGQTIDIDYPTIMARCEFLLTPINMNLWRWEALAMGIAIATGRRAIEVLVQGKFTKTGKYSLKFSGQAKERGGIDYENEFDIYSLIEADKVIAGIEMLRSYPNIRKMVQHLTDGRHYQFNELVHNRTATHLNEFMRDVMRGAKMETGIPDRNWVFKDTRAIYAAICFRLFFDTDNRWKNVDQDMFFQTLLGHSDPKAQAHYKQFKILRAGSKWDTIKSDKKDRLKDLQRFDSHDAILASKALVRMHDNVKTLLKQDPDVKVTQRAIKEEFGGNYATIRKYLAIVDEALSYETTLETILASEPMTGTPDASKPSETAGDKELDDAPSEREKSQPEHEAAPAAVEKPKFKTINQGDGAWLVDMDYRGKTYTLDVTADNSMMAMKACWQKFELLSDLPENPRVDMTKKDGWWIARIMHKGVIVSESMGPGNKSEHETAAIAAYREKYSQFWG